MQLLAGIKSCLTHIIYLISQGELSHLLTYFTCSMNNPLPPYLVREERGGGCKALKNRSSYTPLSCFWFTVCTSIKLRHWSNLCARKIHKLKPIKEQVWNWLCKCWTWPQKISVSIGVEGMCISACCCHHPPTSSLSLGRQSTKVRTPNHIFTVCRLHQSSQIIPQAFLFQTSN